MLENIQVGDEVAVMQYSNHKPTHPAYLTKVTKVTPRRIYTGTRCFWEVDTGRPLHSTRHEWMGSGKTSHISNAPKDLKPLLDIREADNARRVERERLIAERDARKTYQLASEICASWSKDPIADLELLGEEYLQQIVDDIAKAKAEVGK